ncbi:MAG TPA: hypothetical protein VK879_22885 [Candidatus Sulfomarinibacteraceae bacterium]|nr:hypothetical protein [Candidatus Sulfomarinibacteraceae bacterium]
MSDPLPITFHVDQEHGGLQITVLFILFATFLAAFFVLNAALPLAFPQFDSVFVLSCLGALPLSLLVTGASERVLKKRWRSGRRLIVHKDVMRLERPQQVTSVVDREASVNGLWWYFPLEGYQRGGRERRVPNGWFCMAAQFQTDEARIVAYCYTPPARQQEWTERFDFRRLNPSDVYDTSIGARLSAPQRPEIAPEIIAGENGRYWLAERNRWREGVELTPDDFERLLLIVRTDNQVAF